MSLGIDGRLLVLGLRQQRTDIEGDPVPNRSRRGFLN